MFSSVFLVVGPSISAYLSPKELVPLSLSSKGINKACGKIPYQCHHCKALVTMDSAFKCEAHDDIDHQFGVTCLSCSNECYCCMDIFCPSDVLLCEVLDVTNKKCGVTTCSKHSFVTRTCSKCGKRACMNHKTKCWREEGEWMCHNCAFQCKLCGDWSCEKHIKKCCQCHNFVCEEFCSVFAQDVCNRCNDQLVHRVIDKA